MASATVALAGTVFSDRGDHLQTTIRFRSTIGRSDRAVRPDFGTKPTAKRATAPTIADHRRWTEAVTSSGR